MRNGRSGAAACSIDKEMQTLPDVTNALLVLCFSIASMKISNCVSFVLLVAGLCHAVPLTSPNSAAVLISRQAGLPDLLSCPASSWPPTTVGVNNTPQTPNAELTNLLSQILPANIEASILKLVSFHTRNTLSVDISNSTFGIGGARDWLLSEYARYGAANPSADLQVSLNSYIQEPDGDRIPFPVNISSVVAFLPGSTYQSPSNPGRLYVISGHYDTRATNVLDYETLQPGADDDASGVAISLELARIMSQPGAPKMRGSLVFVAVAGEEQGLYGANNLAFTYRNATPSVNVEGMFTCDIVGSPKAKSGYDTGNTPSDSDPYTIRLFAQGIPSLDVENATVRAQRITVGGDSDSPARNLGRFVREVAENEATNMSVALVNRQDRYLRGGDHTPFLNAGYPAARFTEPYEDYRHQHQDVREEDGQQYGDLPEFCDYEYISRVGKVNLAALYSLAQSPGVPQNVNINTSALTNDATFLWDPPVGGEDVVSGYEVVWRATTAPQWQKVVDVGMAEEVKDSSTGRKQVTVGLSKDNVVFGLRARSVEGYRGVAVFPFPVS